jgi:23S rRNA (adenine1618-N6)-methyltransferase
LRETKKQLPEKNLNIPTEKSNLHPRNLHRFRYDFEQLISSFSELKPFVFINKYDSQTIDFSNPKAVKMLNKAILKHFYGISYWDIPDNYLCPPVPGRADYIHYIADLLALNNRGIIPKGNIVKVLDIGVGANCIYPIIGSTTYGWDFVGSDIDPLAVESAEKIVVNNDSLTGKIEIRLQTSQEDIFKGIILSDEIFDVSICNPPFHASLEEATFGTQRKIKNLTGNKYQKPTLNFGGQNAELWCKGGEENFVIKMIKESALIPTKCLWFTSLISKKEHLPNIYKAMKSVKAVEVRTIDMAQGQKISRIVAWTFQQISSSNK